MYACMYKLKEKRETGRERERKRTNLAMLTTDEGHIKCSLHYAFNFSTGLTFFK